MDSEVIEPTDERPRPERRLIADYLFPDKTVRKHHKDVLLALVAGLWAAIGVSIPASQITNERKDAVMSGFVGDHRIDIVHRQAILDNDWHGLVLANISVGVVFAILLVLIGSELKWCFRLFCLGCGTLSLGFAALWDYTAFFEDKPAMEHAIVCAKLEEAFLVQPRSPVAQRSDRITFSCPTPVPVEPAITVH